MVRNIKIIDYLPGVLKEVSELKAIDSVENGILEQEWMLAFNALDNQFINTADENAIARYERMLSIRIEADDDIETRRLRILSRLKEQAPYSIKVLRRILDSLLGKDNYIIQRNVANKNLVVLVELSVSSQIKILEDTLERILPANMTYQVTQRFNTHSYVGGLTHLDLMNYTHREIREDDLFSGSITYDSLSSETYDYLSSFTYTNIFKGEI